MQQNGSKLMSHMVAGYPSLEASWDVARALIDGGSTYLEVQFPFSDPSADGVPIQKACTVALDNGFKVRQGFDLISRIRSITRVPIFIMSYASIVVARGIGDFITTAKECGASGLIIPDLMPGYDENLYAEARNRQVDVIPVIAPGVTDVRLDEILALGFPYLYASLRVGITGSRTELSADVLHFIDRLKATNRKILAGFGIQSREQVITLREHVHALVVGSALVRSVDRAVSGNLDVYDTVRKTVSELVFGINS